MSVNFFEALHQIATDKGITRTEIEQIVESAILSAFKKQYGSVENVKVVFNREADSVLVVAKKMVVNNPRNFAEEIAYTQAVKLDPGIKLGDEIFVEENPFVSFGRIAAQTAKQIILQKIREAEKNIIYNEYKDREGDLINGYLQRKTRDSLYVDLGKTEGVIPAKEQSPLEHYKTGDRIKALILSVQRSAKGPGIILSRTHPRFVERLFEMEIPEIYDGVVEIVNIVREPGMRTKVAVRSVRDDVDSVGACVGMKGIRIQSIVREMEGEKVDIVQHSDDNRIMASNALTPSQVNEIVPLSGEKVLAVVESEQYKLAVGRAGHNVRLAARLCGFEIDIKTEEQYREFLSSSESKAIVEQLFSKPDEDETALEELPGLDAKTIKLLEAGGVFSVEDLVEKSLEDLMGFDGIGEKTARKILEIIAECVDFEDEDEDEEDSGDEGAEGESEPVDAEESDKEAGENISEEQSMDK